MALEFERIIVITTPKGCLEMSMLKIVQRLVGCHGIINREHVPAIGAGTCNVDTIYLVDDVPDVTGVTFPAFLVPTQDKLTVAGGPL